MTDERSVQAGFRAAARSSAERGELEGPEKNTGLKDPRTIHPSPDDIFPEAGEIRLPNPPSDADSLGQDENGKSDDVDGGIVDPRYETIGPDI